MSLFGGPRDSFGVDLLSSFETRTRNILCLDTAWCLIDVEHTPSSSTALFFLGARLGIC